MIIQKIELNNFTCYYGHNEFEFQKGINVIIGDNGFGKSQLFDAFFWVIHNKIFMSKELRNFKDVNINIISDKAKCESNDGIIETSVIITFLDQRTDKVFKLERSFQATKTNDQIIGNADSVFTVWKKELSYLNAKLVTDEEEIKSILSRILPPNKTEYLWFQGEQVDKIIDFQQQDSLKKAIDVLSNIDVYDKIQNFAQNMARISQDEYDKEVKKLSRDKNKSEELEKRKKNIEGLIKIAEEQEAKYKDTITEAEERCEDLINKLEDAGNIKVLREKKELLQNNLNDISISYEKEVSTFHRRMYQKRWILKGCEDLFSNYQKLFSQYEEKKLDYQRKKDLEKYKEEEAQKILTARLPMDVPEPIYVESMLKQERCLVCDRPALKNTEPWYKIKELIDRRNNLNGETINKENPRMDFRSEYRNIYNNGLFLSRGIENIDGEISESIATVLKLESDMKRIALDKADLERKIEELIARANINEEQAKNIYNEYHGSAKIAKDANEKLNSISQLLNNYKREIEPIKDELESLVTGEIPAWLMLKKTTLKDFEGIAISTKQRVFENLVKRLETQANEHYNEMTANIESIKGQIRLLPQKNGSYMPAITDINGIPLHGLNTSNLILVKLSVIMAIISANFQDYGGSMENGIDLYTFITDAPTSVFGDSYTIGFCKTVSKVYNQSIIMSKEFYRNDRLKKELLSNNEIKLGNVYVITPSIVEADRLDRTKLSTNIKKIN